MEELHPEHVRQNLLLHPFMHMILGPSIAHMPHSVAVDSNNNNEEKAALPYITHIPWRYSPTPLVGLTSAICALPPARRLEISRIRTVLADKRCAFQQFH